MASLGRYEIPFLKNLETELGSQMMETILIRLRIPQRRIKRQLLTEFQKDIIEIAEVNSKDVEQRMK